MKRALITRITGQDGLYLADFLFSLGYEVHGLARQTGLVTSGEIYSKMSRPNFTNAVIYML